MSCPLCAATVPADSRFCPSCGGRLASTCTSCGSPLDAADRFCRICGAQVPHSTARGAEPAPLSNGPAADRAPRTPSRAAVAERRQVSVLFADLVGFTPLSEQRDPEEVRELLTRYFESATTVITRYGGTVEKFIGDAVMALWGAPVAQEDDAERAVRAALDLVVAVNALGAEVGADALRMRAGIVTGDAAITVGAQGQGMVAGDIVNTAARVQAAAPPGGVLVDDATQRLTMVPIAYDDAGTHALKGKSEAVHLWQASRVVAMIGGKWRAGGELEAPFVGRDREFRLVKELFHATVEEGRARLVSVTGLAGIGKTRLAWEFHKYIDGLSETVWWHSGRCLAYGEGVTYWALAEMVRRRADIVEAEAPESAAAKLRAALERYITDDEERRWLEPRMAHLLGLEERSAADRVELFAAWRLFFERLAETSPTVLIFEEMQWADTGLVDFVEYLLDWSRHHPLFIVTLARPELSDRHPAWGSGKRSFHSLYLEPLSSAAMEELLTGLVPGLPAELRNRIRDRAEGVPLYAVETVRMLLDRGLLRREGNQYAITGAVGDLDVPQSLHALIAARLDALPAGERALLQDAAVLGQSFTRARLAALAGLDEVTLTTLLESLARKEFLTVQSDPRSPERGQYAFLQALVQRVAYETLSRRDRKLRHLEAARQLETTWAKDADDVVEVVAAHYLEAHRAAPDDDDAVDIAASARRMLLRAGQRATGLGAAAEAEHYFVLAADLAEDPVERAGLLEQAGEMGARKGTLDARAHFEAAIAGFERAGHSHPAARVSAKLGRLLFTRGQHSEGLALLERAFSVLGTDAPDGDLGRLASELGRAYILLGREDEARPPLELAIEIAEAEDLVELLAETLITKSFVLHWSGRRAEPMALQRHALALAEEHDLSLTVLRARYNLSDLLVRCDRFEEALEHAEGALAVAHRLGHRDWAERVLGNLVYPLFVLSRWDEALAATDDLSASASAAMLEPQLLTSCMLVPIFIARGDLDTARRLTEIASHRRGTIEVQVRVVIEATLAHAAWAEGAYAEATALGAAAFDLSEDIGVNEAAQDAFAVAVDSALMSGDLESASALLRRVDELPRTFRTRLLTAHTRRFRARIAAVRGDADAAAADFAASQELFGEIGAVFARAMTQLEHAEWLATLDRGDAVTPAREAAAVFESLGAAPWLERAARLTLGGARREGAEPSMAPQPALGTSAG